jgi:hypothetical protein
VVAAFAAAYHCPARHIDDAPRFLFLRQSCKALLFPETLRHEKAQMHGCRCIDGHGFGGRRHEIVKGRRESVASVVHDRSIVDENVDATKTRNHVLDERLNPCSRAEIRVEAADVVLRDSSREAVGDELSCGCGVGAVRKRDALMPPGEVEADFLANVTRAASNKNDAPGHVNFRLNLPGLWCNTHIGQFVSNTAVVLSDNLD